MRKRIRMLYERLGLPDRPPEPRERTSLPALPSSFIMPQAEVGPTGPSFAAVTRKLEELVGYTVAIALENPTCAHTTASWKGILAPIEVLSEGEMAIRFAGAELETEISILEPLVDETAVWPDGLQVQMGPVMVEVERVPDDYSEPAEDHED